jgi:DHA1 family multidrug resistance protein-like MFS transporter
LKVAVEVDLLKNINQGLLTLFALNVAIGLTTQLVQPLFPLYLKEIGASEIENALVISLGNLSSTLLMLPAGLLIGRFNMRIFMVLSAALSGFSVLLLTFTRDWALVIPLNILLNVSLCLFMPARMAIIAENTTPTNRASLFGVMNLAWPIAGIAGPLAGGYLIEHVGWSNVFIIAASISFVALFPANRIQQTKVEPNKLKAKKSSDLSIFDKKYTPIMATLFGLQVLVTTCMAGVNMILPIYLQDHYHLSYALIGAFFTGSNILLIVTQIGGGIIADKYGRGRLILICTVLAPLTLGAWVFFDNWIILFVIYALAFALWSLTWPPMLALLTDLLPRELHGAGFGLNMTASRLGFTIGPIIAGFFYAVPGSISPFIVSTLIYTLAIPFAYILKKKENESSS